MTDNQESKKLTDKEAADILSKALLFLLRDHEGIFVETPEGQYVVGSVDGGVFIDSKDVYMLADGSKGEFVDGGLLWLHDTKEEAELATALDSAGIDLPPFAVRSTATH
jgi:hypothetical protein